MVEQQVGNLIPCLHHYDDFLPSLIIIWTDYNPLPLSCLSHYCFGSVLQQPSLYPNTLGTHHKQIPTENMIKSTVIKKGWQGQVY